MSAAPEPAERRQLENSLFPGWRADSGCWHHLQWPLGPGETPAGRRLGGGIPSSVRIGKLLAFRPGKAPAAWKLRPGAVR
ncbi:MAG TPA: hypothetical protein VF200_00260 [Woeseiaceae bacterium]